jgi:hypothetical protein
MEFKERMGYDLFRDWDNDYEQYREALKFSEVVKGTTLVEKETKTIVEKHPLKIHISEDDIERTRRQVELSLGFFNGSSRNVEWMKDDDNSNTEACIERAKPVCDTRGAKGLNDSLTTLCI